MPDSEMKALVNALRDDLHTSTTRLEQSISERLAVQEHAQATTAEAVSTLVRKIDELSPTVHVTRERVETIGDATKELGTKVTAIDARVDAQAHDVADVKREVAAFRKAAAVAGTGAAAVFSAAVEWLKSHL